MLPTTPLHCDVFCNVIDNHGDIGVCWRLARQLVAEHGVGVRLWVDEMRAFAPICPELNPAVEAQTVSGVEIRRWAGDFAEVSPGDLVIEAFACHLPEAFVEAMARREPRPVWLNLDYLSAEDWVSGCHALPSPHPRLPITKYFFFPGFNQATGGLLRERGLAGRREAFLASAEERIAFWHRLGIEPPAEDTLKISLFAYENPAIPRLLSAFVEGERRACCFVPLTRSRGDIERFLGQAVRPGDVFRRGQLELHVLSFVSQAEYDRLLWSCDLNFVRGEDSFVRAQWAARPIVWQIYPQGDDAHRVKLEAFVDIHCAGLPLDLANLLRRMFLAWNGFADFSTALVSEWLARLPDYRQHAIDWEKNLSKQQDLCSSLVRFCKSKL